MASDRPGSHFRAYANVRTATGTMEGFLTLPLPQRRHSNPPEGSGPRAGSHAPRTYAQRRNPTHSFLVKPNVTYTQSTLAPRERTQLLR